MVLFNSTIKLTNNVKNFHKMPRLLSSNEEVRKQLNSVINEQFFTRNVKCIMRLFAF